MTTEALPQVLPALTLQFERHPDKPETKNCFRYQETGSVQRIGSLYINKLAFGGSHPKRLTVTVEAE